MRVPVQTLLCSTSQAAVPCCDHVSTHYFAPSHVNTPMCRIVLVMCDLQLSILQLKVFVCTSTRWATMLVITTTSNHLQMLQRRPGPDTGPALKRCSTIYLASIEPLATHCATGLCTPAAAATVGLRRIAWLRSCCTQPLVTCQH